MKTIYMFYVVPLVLFCGCISEGEFVPTPTSTFSSEAQVYEEFELSARYCDEVLYPANIELNMQVGRARWTGCFRYIENISDRARAWIIFYGEHATIEEVWIPRYAARDNLPAYWEKEVNCHLFTIDRLLVEKGPLYMSRSDDTMRAVVESLAAMCMPVEYQAQLLNEPPGGFVQWDGTLRCDLADSMEFHNRSGAFGKINPDYAQIRTYVCN